MSDYYSTTSQVIGVLLLALLVAPRLVDGNGSQPGRRAGVILLGTIVAGVGWSQSFEVLLSSSRGTDVDAGIVAVSIAILTLCLVVLGVGTPFEAWWRTRRPGAAGRPERSWTDLLIVFVAAVPVAGLLTAVYLWAGAAAR